MNSPSNNKHPHSIGREYCLRFLYFYQFQEKRPLSAGMPTDIGELIQVFEQSLPNNLRTEGKDFGIRLILGTLKNQTDIENYIKKSLNNWKFDNISKVDLTILYLAIFELKFMKDLSANIIINEALELTHRYSTQEAKSFINGVLDHVSKS